MSYELGRMLDHAEGLMRDYVTAHQLRGLDPDPTLMRDVENLETAVRNVRSLVPSAGGEVHAI
jgi:hypothetical protein